MYIMIQKIYYPAEINSIINNISIIIIINITIINKTVFIVFFMFISVVNIFFAFNNKLVFDNIK